MVEKQMPDDGGWIEWSGGECPVAPETMVAIQFKNIRDGVTWTRDGYEEAGHFDGLGWWQGKFARHQITAYRIVSQSLPNTHESGGR